MMKRISVFLLIALFASCGTSNHDERIKAVCTIAQIADVVRNVAGERFHVINLMGEGVDPHLYKASPADLGYLANGDVVFYNGLMLEGRMTEIFEKLENGPRPVIAFGASMPKDRLRSPKEFEGHYDPHIWMSVDMWASAVPSVVETLSRIDPDGEAIYRKNGETYSEKLEELHNWVKEQIATVPKDQRVLITAHDAFGYFGEAYDIEVMGLQGISTVSEFGLQDLQRLIEVVVARNVKAVFVESSVPVKSIEALVAGCKAKNHGIFIGGELFSDAMGAAGTDEGTYIGMIRHNVNTIVKALK